MLLAVLVPLALSPPPSIGRRSFLASAAGAAALPVGAASAVRPIEKASGVLAELPLTVGLGTCLVTDGRAPLQVEQAIGAGYRVFDTAQRYGNEGGVGKALAKGFAAGALRREEAHVTTKVWVDNMGRGQTEASVRASAKALGLDYLDTVLVHWPGEFVRRGEGSNDVVNSRLRRETWRELEGAQRAGLVRRIGVSNFSERHLRELLELAEIRPAVRGPRLSGPRLRGYRRLTHTPAAAHAASSLLLR